MAKNRNKRLGARSTIAKLKDASPAVIDYIFGFARAIDRCAASYGMSFEDFIAQLEHDIEAREQVATVIRNECLKEDKSQTRLGRRANKDLAKRWTETYVARVLKLANWTSEAPITLDQHENPASRLRRLHRGKQGQQTMANLQQRLDENKARKAQLEEQLTDYLYLEPGTFNTSSVGVGFGIRPSASSQILGVTSGELALARDLSAERQLLEDVRGHKLPTKTTERYAPTVALMAHGRYFNTLAQKFGKEGHYLEPKAIVSTLGDHPKFMEVVNYWSFLVPEEDCTAFDEIRHALVDWYRCGFPFVSIPHKLAASMAFTYGTSYVTPPWPAFFVRAPQDVIKPKSTGSLKHVFVHAQTDEDGQAVQWHLYLHWEDNENTSMPEIIKLAKLDKDELDDPKFPAEQNRVIELIVNLVAGICMLATDSEYIAQQIPKRPKSQRRNRPKGSLPFETAQYVISKNVEIDLRQSVAEYIQHGKKKSVDGRKLTCQFVVRGHRRWQACGKGLKSRKLIWIEPYWKGPQDARALLRGYSLKTQEDMVSSKST